MVRTFCEILSTAETIVGEPGRFRAVNVAHPEAIMAFPVPKSYWGSLKIGDTQERVTPVKQRHGK